MTVVKKNPDVKALLDEYDVTQDDEGYSQYKYDALEKKLKELLDSEELELMHARRINKNWPARQLDVRSNIFPDYVRSSCSNLRTGPRPNPGGVHGVLQLFRPVLGHRHALPAT